MAGRRPPTRKPTAFAQTPKVSDGKTQRALDVLSQAILDLQARQHFGLFSATDDGYVPASSGSADEYLAGDGTWRAVAGGSAVDSVTAGSAMVYVSPTTGAVVVDVVPANFTGIPESGVTGLVADLAGKAALSHTHAESDITGLAADLAARPTGSGTTNKVAKWGSSTTLSDSSITDTGALVTIANPINVTGTADFDSSVLINSTLTVNGATDLDSTLNVDGAVTMMSTANVAGNFSVATNKLTVAAASGNTVVAGTINVQGAADLDSTLNVDGALTVGGNATLGANSANNTTINGLATITGANADQTLTIANTGTGGRTYQLISSATASALSPQKFTLYDPNSVGSVFWVDASGNVTFTYNVSVSGNVTIEGNSTFGNAASDTATALGYLRAYSALSGSANVDAFNVGNLTSSSTSADIGWNIGLDRSVGYVYQDTKLGATGALIGRIGGGTNPGYTNAWLNVNTSGNVMFYKNVDINQQLYVAGAAFVDGNVQLGNAVTDAHTVNGLTTQYDEAADGSLSASNAGFAVVDTLSATTGVGGGIALHGAYTGTTTTVGGLIKATKANSTGGNFEFDMVFATRYNGSSDVAEVLRLYGASGVGAKVTGALNVTEGATLGNAAGDTHVINGSVQSNKDDTYLAWDVSQHRLGITKKAGFFPKVTYGSGTDFAIAQSNGTSIDASGTFTDKITISSAGAIGLVGNTTVTGTFNTTGNTTIGDAGGDAHALTGTLNANSTSGTAGQVLTIVSGVPKWATPSGGAAGGLLAGSLSAVPTQSSTGLSSWLNQPASATVTDDVSGLVVYAPNQSSSDKGAVLYRAAPSTPYKITICVGVSHDYASNAGIWFGFADGNTSSAKGERFQWKPFFSGSDSLSVVRGTGYNPSVFSAYVKQTTIGITQAPYMWFQLDVDSTTVRYKFSLDGRSWITYTSVTKSGSFLGSSGYSYIIFGVGSYASDTYATMYSWAVT